MGSEVKTVKVFGVTLTQENLLKLACLIFSVGMLWKKVDNLEERQARLEKFLDAHVVIVTQREASLIPSGPSTAVSLQCPNNLKEFLR